MYQGESFEIEFKEVDAQPRDFNAADEIIIAVRVNNVEMLVFKLGDNEIEVDGSDSSLVRVIGGLDPADTVSFPTGRMLVEMKAEFPDEVFITQFTEPVTASITTAI